jgi:hypothetical protein
VDTGPAGWIRAQPGGYGPSRVDTGPTGWIRAQPCGYGPSRVDTGPAVWIRAEPGGCGPIRVLCLPAVFSDCRAHRSQRRQLGAPGDWGRAGEAGPDSFGSGELGRAARLYGGGGRAAGPMEAGAATKVAQAAATMAQAAAKAATMTAQAAAKAAAMMAQAAAKETMVTSTQPALSLETQAQAGAVAAAAEAVAVAISRNGCGGRRRQGMPTRRGEAPAAVAARALGCSRAMPLKHHPRTRRLRRAWSPARRLLPRRPCLLTYLLTCDCELYLWLSYTRLHISRTYFHFIQAMVSAKIKKLPFLGVENVATSYEGH